MPVLGPEASSSQVKELFTPWHRLFVTALLLSYRGEDMAPWSYPGLMFSTFGTESSRLITEQLMTERAVLRRRHGPVAHLRDININEAQTDAR